MSFDIIGNDPLQRLERLRPLDQNLAHMGNIEQTNALAHCRVLGNQALVLNRQFPANERHHTRAAIDLNRVYRSLAKLRHERGEYSQGGPAIKG